MHTEKVNIISAFYNNLLQKYQRYTQKEGRTLAVCPSLAEIEGVLLRSVQALLLE